MAETLIAIALVGGLLVPMLFFTSAYFSRELVKNRQQFALYHNTAKVLHTLSNELGNSYRILADSTSTELHYAYYDPVQQSEIRRGYRLTASGSDLKLQRLTYNTGSATWTATTPYGIDKDDAMTIAAGTTFDYCAASDCAVSPEDALSLRLNNWVITDAREKRTLTLPSVQIYLNPSADTNFQLSTTAQELFSTTTASAFGASSNLNVTTLDPGGAWLDNIYIASVAPGLSTLVVNETSPNDGIMIDRTTGRAFFAYDTRLLSYLPSTGLSTIATGLSNASTLFNNNMVYDSLADLLYFKDNGRLFAYSGATGLSTLANSDVAEDCLAVVPDATASRVYSCSGTSIYTWTASTGVSTIAVTGQASVGSELTLKADRQSGRVYFSEPAVATGGRVYTWHPSTGLTTLISDGRYVGNDYGGVQVYESSSSPQVLFTENFDSATRRAYVWSPVNGLSTILTNGRNLCELDTVNVYGENLGGDPYIQRCGFDSNGRVFFDEFNPTPGNSNFYTWTLAAGLTTLMRTQDYRRFFTNPVSGRSYFARIDEYSSEEPAFTTHLNAWAQSTGLSTLNWSSLYSRPLSAVFNSDYSRLYLREYNNTGFLEYNETANTTASYYTSGTTITANRIDYDSTGDFLAVRGGNNVWLWSPSSGLSTIFNLPVADPGTVAIKSAKNFVYFADKGGGVASNFYIYVVGASGGSSVRRADPLGGYTNTTKSLTASGATSGIAGAAYDNDRKIYLLDNTSREVDCYQESSNVYTLASSLGWSGGASTVSAIAIDSADASIALLDAGNNQIDVYSDRSVNGAATPTSSISLAGLGVTTPTGLAISGRTGNYLVLDSALQSGTSVRLFVINTAGTLVSTISINVTSSNLSTSATTETNFKIVYNDQTNVLYLLAPTLNRIFALSIPSLV